MMITDQQIRILAAITTRNEAGRHFTEVFAVDDLEQLEAGGLIEITRPVHEATGIAYSQEYSSVLVTETGQTVVDEAIESGFDFDASEGEDDDSSSDDIDQEDRDAEWDAAERAVAVAAEQAWRIRHLERLLVLAYQAIDPERIDSTTLLEIELQVGARACREVGLVPAIRAELAQEETP